MTTPYDDPDLDEEQMDRDMRRLIGDLDIACTTATLPPARRAAIAHLLAASTDGRRPRAVPTDRRRRLAWAWRSVVDLAGAAPTGRRPQPLHRARTSPWAVVLLAVLTFGGGVAAARVFPQSLGVEPALPAAFASTGVPSGPDALAIDARSDHAFLLAPGGARVDMFDARNGTLLRRTPVGPHPSALVVAARAGRVFVAHSSTNTVSVLDADSGVLLGTTVVGLHPQALVVDEGAGRVFVVSAGPLDRRATPPDHGAMSVLDARSGHVLGAVTVGYDPLAVAVDVRTGHVVVAYREGGAAVKGHALDLYGDAVRCAPRAGRLSCTLIPAAPTTTTSATRRPLRSAWSPRPSARRFTR